MSMGLETGRADHDAKDAQAAAFGCCALLFLLVTVGWLSVQGVRRACRWLDRLAPVYPDPVCEFCGEVLDGTHAACSKDLDTSAAIRIARVSGGP